MDFRETLEIADAAEDSFSRLVAEYDAPRRLARRLESHQSPEYQRKLLEAATFYG